MPLPPGYVLPKGNADPSQVGSLYHLAIGTKSTPSLASPDSIVGFMLENKPDQLFEESTDVNARTSFTSHSGPNLLDRDLVTYPRVTQGDFSGGILQPVFINKSLCYDTDLFTDNPGYLQLTQGVTQLEVTSSIGTNQWFPQVVRASGYTVCHFGDGTVYVIDSTGAVTTPTFPAEIAYICTDGTYVYAGSALGGLYRLALPGTVVTIASAVNGTIANVWFVNLGSNGYHLYYSNTLGNLYWLDVSGGTAFPIATTSQFQVALGNSIGAPFDVVRYGTGIALRMGNKIWYNDGQNTTPIYSAGAGSIEGLCECQGDLYVVVYPDTAGGPSSLIQISSGAAQEVISYGVPQQFQLSNLGAPVAGQTKVFMEAGLPVDGLVANYFLIYDTATQAISHTPLATTGNPPATVGDTYVLVYTTPLGGKPTAGWLEFQNASQIIDTTALAYEPSGHMVTSLYDFGTPSITKLFRRVLITHAPLPTGASISIEAHVDEDPTAYVLGTTAPNPVGATITNSTAGSTITILTLPASTRGRTMYFVIGMTAGTSNLTTPVITWISTEVGIGWTWKFKIGCFRAQQTLSGMEDQQGMKGQDKYFFLQQLQENAVSMTFYHPNQVPYTATVEQMTMTIRNPVFEKDMDGPADLEFVADVTLRWAEGEGQ